MHVELFTTIMTLKLTSNEKLLSVTSQKIYLKERENKGLKIYINFVIKKPFLYSCIRTN